uniref:Uncharacterized protein n=1 Tax=Anguilla anguilla TaxID=7936 RepID=A0A0E9TD11_ANGAN
MLDSNYRNKRKNNSFKVKYTQLKQLTATLSLSLLSKKPH